jgi:RimJ/RimL family protein N-acetyltransferase
MLPSFGGITLRPVTEDDMPFLFQVFADPGRCHLWMRDRKVYDERGFHHAWISWTGDLMAAKFVVESAGRAVGLVFDYDRSLEDGYTKVTALLEEGSTGHGGGVIATTLLVSWLFQNLPLRKVYMDVYAYNPAVVGMLRKLGFTEEGMLKEVRYRDGAYWDLHVFALSREAYPQVRDRLLRLSRAEQQFPPAGSASLGRERSLAEERTSTNGCLNPTE